MKLGIVAATAVVLLVAPAQARHHRHYRRVAVQKQPTQCIIFQPCFQQDWFTQQVIKPVVTAPVRVVHGVVRAVQRVVHEAATYLPHPEGCPWVAFCGCGAAHDLGLHDRTLWLASNWLKFPRSAPAPNTVAVRRHHVFVLKEHVMGMMWRVNNYNGRGHRSSSYVRSISGYTIVKPI